MTMLKRPREQLLSPADPAPLACFRIAWGVLMLLESMALLNLSATLFHPNLFHFTFTGFSWVRPLPELWMVELEIYAMALAAAAIALGIGTRPACLLFAAGYAHFLFSEAANYNNHYYLIILITFLLGLTRSDETHSLRAHFRKKRKADAAQPAPVPFWNYGILRLQVIIVYLYAAIAKISHDWLLEAEPVRFWLDMNASSGRPLASFLGSVVPPHVFAWSGFLIDLTVPFLLVFRRTRLLAFAILVAFHVFNSQLFRIGYFPLLASALLLVFVPVRSGGASTILDRLVPSRRFLKPAPLHRPPRRVLTTVLVVFFLFQILFPLRWILLLPRDPSWTDCGKNFAWRMMQRHRVGTHEFYFLFPDGSTELPPGARIPLAPVAAIRVATKPHEIWRLAQETRRRLEKLGYDEVQIYVHACASLNGRPYHPVIDPNVDLGRASLPLFGVPVWIPRVPSPDNPRTYFTRSDDIREECYKPLRTWFDAHPGPGEQFLEKPHSGPAR